MPDLALYDHVRPADGSEFRDGVYRVVGTNDGGATLLRVSGADGRRANTGEVVSVSSDELGGFEAADNPDDGWSPSTSVRSALDGFYWSARTFVETLAERPIPAVVALALLLAGEFGQGALGLSGLQAAALILVGGFGLLYLGSGRL
ncbi:hypothetical protein [Haloarcula marina]|uniref:hypothetical protein n=1 Tax=Haloarcula marina TaxID=2961574 RepID=UPI0020B6A425|nr:hypothetical protein [Halomicroarcula marina]